MTTPPLLTTRQLADRWQLHPETILRHRKAGLLPSVTLPSGAIRYRLDDVEQVERRTPEISSIMGDGSPPEKRR